MPILLALAPMQKFAPRVSCAMRTSGLLPIPVVTRCKPRLPLWREIRAIAHKSPLMQFTGHRETEQHAALRIGGGYINRFQTRLVLKQRAFNLTPKRVRRG